VERRKNLQKELAKRYIKDIKSSDVWGVFKVIADFVQGYETLGDLGPSVTIFGGARSSENSDNYMRAKLLAEKLADKGFNIITGGGPGIMEAANKGAFQKHCVESIGLNIDLPHEQIPNPFTTKECTFDYFFSRKVMLVKYSMAYVIFPGGYGTLDELFEALTLIQTKKITGVRLFVIGVDYYTPLITFMRDSLLKEKMIEEEDLEIITLTDDLESVVDEIEMSLQEQINGLKEDGLESTAYFKTLQNFQNKKACGNE
jgi:uncharacterized protein (TIGR00730 family)